MRVAFVDNLLMREDGKPAPVRPHLGLLSLCAVADAGGHESEIVDPKLLLARGGSRIDASFYSRLAEEIEQRRPDVVGFTTLGCGLVTVVRTAELVRELLPRATILLGGPHATILHEEILRRFPFVDAIVRHEAEATLPEVLVAARDGFPSDAEALRGVTWRSDGDLLVGAERGIVERLDDLPLLPYAKYPDDAIDGTLMPIDAGRGCPFACTFCSTASFFGRRYRIKSAARLVAEMDDLHERYGTRRFQLTHDLFTVNARKVEEFCDAVASRDYEWQVSARVDCVDDALLDRMASTGCSRVYFGIEAGSARMQKAVKKHLDLELVIPRVTAAVSLGVDVAVSFIVGYPQERREDQTETLRLLGECVRVDPERVVGQLHMLAPEPGTELFGRMRDEGRFAFDSFGNDHNGLCLDQRDADMVASMPELFSTYHHYVPELSREATRFSVTAFSGLARLGSRVLVGLLAAERCTLDVLIQRLRDAADEATRAGRRVRFSDLLLELRSRPTFASGLARVQESLTHEAGLDETAACAV